MNSSIGFFNEDKSIEEIKTMIKNYQDNQQQLTNGFADVQKNTHAIEEITSNHKNELLEILNSISNLITQIKILQDRKTARIGEIEALKIKIDERKSMLNAPVSNDTAIKDRNDINEITTIINKEINTLKVYNEEVSTINVQLSEFKTIFKQIQDSYLTYKPITDNIIDKLTKFKNLINSNTSIP